MIGTLPNHLWQSTVLAVVAGLFAAALRNNRAEVRYWVWFSASVKFFVPFSLLTNVGSRLAWAPAGKQLVASPLPAVALAMVQIAQPFSNGFLSAPSTSQTAADWTPTVILGVWACGLVAIVLVRLRGWRRIRAAVRASSPLEIPTAGASAQVRSSPGLLEPGVAGLWHPILLVPAGIEQHLTPPQLKAVLAHELCHIRRRDNLTATIHMIVEAVFWFYPLAWWIGARLVEERERACDECVLRMFSEPQAYAEGILNVCKLYGESPLACVAGVTGSNLKRRIEDIMIKRVGLRLNFARKTALALAATAALAAPIIGGIVTAPLRAQSTSATAPAGRPQPQTSAQSAALIRTKEAALKDALFEMRDAIDQYFVDKKQYPSVLDSLTSARYIGRIPTDPFTNSNHSWQTVPSRPDPKHQTVASGIYDVKSGSRATAIDGTKYSAW